KKTGKHSGEWVIDPAKQKIILDIAERFLAGTSLKELAAEYDMNLGNLHETLKSRAGPVWRQTVKCKELNIDEVVQTRVPALLEDETIRAVAARMDANRTWRHRHIKNQYLLGRMIFCRRCGYAFYGQHNPQTGRFYYRHSRAVRCDTPRGSMDAGVLEGAV